MATPRSGPSDATSPSKPALPRNLRIASSLDPNHSGYSVSDERSVRALSAAENAHFWHLSRNTFIETRLRLLGVARGSRVLELGCGGGAVATHLSQQGYCVTGVEGHLIRAIEAATRAPRADFIVHDLSRGAGELDTALDFDVVALFDVLEHLDTPLDVLTDALLCTRPGGLVVGTVPALMALWSKVDEHAGHRLRYQRRDLQALLEQASGAVPAEIVDFNRHLVPLMWFQRHLVANGDKSSAAEANFRVPPPFVNMAMLLAAGLERFLDARLHGNLLLPGASLWFALRKQAPT